MTAALFALAFAVAFALLRLEHREAASRINNADHIIHNDRIALARHVEMTLREARAKRREMRK